MNKLTTGAEFQVGTVTPEELELARLIVTALNLEVRAEDIDPAAPLYGAGLGLDSIDILEVALAVSKAYGVKLRADDENNRAIFSSLRNLSQHIQRQRSK
jgi:acyl carrier protein